MWLLHVSFVFGYLNFLCRFLSKYLKWEIARVMFKLELELLHLCFSKENGGIGSYV